MNVPTIEMEPDAAQAKLDAYKQQLRRRADEEYEAAVAGYEVLAAGKPLINLTDAFNHTGLGDDGRPRLAIARADRKHVMVISRQDGQVRFDATAANYSTWGYVGALVIDVRLDGVERRALRTGYALIPMVPADVRPKGNLRNFFILWEVEEWADRRFQTEPDLDPYLLQHIAGDLYAVIAEWDLTELERAIMAGRRDV